MKATIMDQSILVGLITGTASVPQDDLSLDTKVTAILHAHGVLRKEMENLVTKGFRPFREFSTKRNGRPVAYNCPFPKSVANMRVDVVFTTDSPMVSGADKCSMKFIRYSALLTTKGDLLWLAENCVGECDTSGAPISDVVVDVEIVPLDRPNLRHYVEHFPELFLKLLDNFKSVAETAFVMREERQERTRKVMNELTRVRRMVGLTRFL